MVVTQRTDDGRFTGVRLPTTCKPVLYDITLEPNLKDFTFVGQVSIELEITPSEAENTISEIVLHANEIDFKDASFVADETYPVKEVVLSSKTETATLVFEKPIKESSGSLNISFTGNLNDKMRGFYRSKYSGPDGEERFATLTQFEEADVRRVFPSWDDTDVKARFAFTLIIDTYMIALSSTNIQHEYTRDDKKVFQFFPTPKISPNLNVLLVGEPEFIDSRFGGRPVRLHIDYSPNDQGQSAQLDCLLQLSDLQDKVSEFIDKRVKAYCNVRLKKLIQRTKSEGNPDEIADDVTAILSVYMRQALTKTMRDLVNKEEVRSQVDRIWDYQRGHCVYNILPVINDSTDKVINELKSKVDELKSIDELTPSIECQSYRNKYVTMRNELDATVNQIESVCSKVASHGLVDVTRRS